MSYQGEGLCTVKKLKEKFNRLPKPKSWEVRSQHLQDRRQMLLAEEFLEKNKMVDFEGQNELCAVSWSRRISFMKQFLEIQLRTILCVVCKLRFQSITNPPIRGSVGICIY